jgi:multiple sugar transport system ATP-binding protein
LYPHMTVYRNMAFGLKLRGMPRPQIHARVMDAAKILDIESLLERRPAELSGGQRQRVAVGRAIVREPAAFLFDEPLSNLDARLRVTTRAELKRLHQRLKTTTIYVTHDQEEAMTLGDRIVVMRNGRIQQADTPLKTYNSPVNRFVAGFIGMPPMNFIDGAIRRIDGELVFEEGEIAGAEGIGGSADGDGDGERCCGAGRGGRLVLPGVGFRLPVPAPLREAMAPWVERHVVLGIRPEHFQLRAMDEDALSAKIEGKVVVIEPLGSTMDVYMDLPLHKHVVGRVEARANLQVGLQAPMYVDLRKIHFFEPGETGMNLSLTSEPAHAVA